MSRANAIPPYKAIYQRLLSVWKINPNPATKNPKDIRNGKIEPFGICTSPKGSAGVICPLPSVFSIHNGSRPRVNGNCLKLSYGGGDDSVALSIVRPSHGSAGAFSPFTAVCTILIKNTITANDIKKAPIVLIRFPKSSP